MLTTRFAAAAAAASASITVHARGTPLLDRLDGVPVHHDVGSTQPPLEPCPGWTAGVPDVDMDEPQRWQTVVDGLPETFVFSAFYDPRYTSSGVARLTRFRLTVPYNIQAKKLTIHR